MSREQEINDGMIRWEPGDLAPAALERVAGDALAELWCGDPGRFDRREFGQLVAAILYTATGQKWEVR